MIGGLVLVIAILAVVVVAATAGSMAMRDPVVGPDQLLRRVGGGSVRTRTGKWRLVAVALAWVGVMLLAGRYAAAALPAGLVAARWLLARNIRSRSVRLFEEQFEQAAVTMANSMRAGQSLMQAMAAVEREYGPPLGSEFRRALQEYHAGLPLIEAIGGIQRRVPCPEAAFFARALGIHGLTGGNIAGVLGNVARIIRQRRLLRGEVMAKSGEARLTAVVLAALPGLLAAYLCAVDRDMLTPLLTTPLGRAGLVYAVISWAVGVAVINRIASSVGGV